MTETALVQRPATDLAEYDVSDVVGQVQKIQQAMKALMKEGEHYGKIPGCGDKPSLLKPGAEKLSFMFRLAPKFYGEREPIELGGGHREIVIRCELIHIPSGMFMGEGVGSCSTLEAKYRFRTGLKEFTGQPVPKEYWNLRKSDPEAALVLIGGRGFGIGKNDAGQWEIVQGSERVEHDNPADHYNTVLKMAKKRAHVDAILTATAASDIFTQDLEDLAGNGVVGAPPQPAKMPGAPAMPQRRSEAPAGAPSASTGHDGEVISEAQRKRFFAIWKNAGIPEDIVRVKLQKFGYQHSKDICKKDYEALCTWAETFGTERMEEVREPGMEG